MSPAISEKKTTSLPKELGAFVERNIDSMSSKQLKELAKQRKLIMQEARRRVNDSAAPCESDSRETPVLQA